MTPPEDGVSRGGGRSHNACLTCRRKKTRCPGERPACSSCVRLKQQCSYAPMGRASRGGRSEERLANLEEKLDLLLSGSLAGNSSRHEQAAEESAMFSEKSHSVTPPGAPSNHPLDHPFFLRFDAETSNIRPPPADLAVGLDLYFKYCHRQPIWCFEREETKDPATISGELACSILALTARFSHKGDRLLRHGRMAKSWVMFHVTNGTVKLETIESLCLLSYSSFIDGNFTLGRFHVGLALQLCRASMMDLPTAYVVDSPTTERKKRLFWSLQVLEQSFGRQAGLLSTPTEIWRPYYTSSTSTSTTTDPKLQIGVEPNLLPLPKDILGCSTPSEAGIWNTSIHLGWVWSRVRKYVSDCAHNILKEPWRHDSMYTMVLSDFMEAENRIPMCHRYDSCKFYERKAEELKLNRDYWAPWLREQFNYHAIHTFLNHPFLYIVGAQRNPNLAIPNTFWRRSSELALIHSTWIVRLIDMILDKQMPLVDPYFCHIAAVAATVHLYFCCAAHVRLKQKSTKDFAKCRRFLKTFASFSPACRALEQKLDKLTQIAVGSENTDVEDWMPSKIYLSERLMWDILQLNSPDLAQDNPSSPSNPSGGAGGGGLLHGSMTPTAPQDEMDDSLMLEIVVTTSPDVTVNIADGGQVAPVASFKAPMSSPSISSRQTISDDIFVAPTDSLAVNATPWLWTDPSQFVDMGEMGYPDTPMANAGMAWWDVGNFGDAIFNHS